MNAPATQPQHILIVRPSALGDVCRTVPVLASLHRAFPGAEIDWIVQDTFIDAVQSHPAVSEVIPFPRARLARWWRSPKAFAETLRWFRDLRRRGYDLVLDCQGLGRSGLMTWITGALRRVGYREARELAWLGYNFRHPLRPGLHTVNEMLALLEHEKIPTVADMRLHVSKADQAWWKDQCAHRTIGAGRYVVFAPTARWPSKRWPIERWRDLAPSLLERCFERIVIIGSPDERGQIQGIMPADEETKSAMVDLVGQTTVGQTMAIVDAAGLVIANDSAPLHMAVGLDRPCVAMFGPTDPEIVGPYGRMDSVLRKHDPPLERESNYRDPKLGDALMRLITVEDVLDRVDRILKRKTDAAAQPKQAAKTGANWESTS